MKAHGRIYRLSGVFWYEGKKVVGKCPELGVSSFGRNIEEAKMRLTEAADLYLENAKLLGMLSTLHDTLSAPERFATTLEIPA